MKEYKLGEFTICCEGENAFVKQGHRLLEEFFGKQGETTALQRATDFVLEDTDAFPDRFEWMQIRAGEVVPLVTRATHDTIPAAREWKNNFYPFATLVLVKIEGTVLEVSFARERP